MSEIQLNTSYRFHLKIALFIGFWVTFFLIAIAPFDVANLSLQERLSKMPVYGLVLFLSYSVIIPVQNWLYHQTKRWTILSEAFFALLFGLLVLIGSFFYYQSDLVGGGSDFLEFSGQIFLPIFIMLATVIVFVRWHQQRGMRKEEELVTITDANLVLEGENKQDRMDVNRPDLVSIWSAGNYVEVYFLKNGSLEKKIIRTTLKRVKEQLPFLVKVHRSYLINPDHFIEWKDAATIRLTQQEVGVSRKYKKGLAL